MFAGEKRIPDRASPKSIPTLFSDPSLQKVHALSPIQIFLPRLTFRGSLCLLFLSFPHPEGPSHPESWSWKTRLVRMPPRRKKLALGSWSYLKFCFCFAHVWSKSVQSRSLLPLGSHCPFKYYNYTLCAILLLIVSPHWTESSLRGETDASLMSRSSQPSSCPGWWQAQHSWLFQCKQAAIRRKLSDWEHSNSMKYKCSV